MTNDGILTALAEYCREQAKCSKPEPLHEDRLRMDFYNRAAEIILYIREATRPSQRYADIDAVRFVKTTFERVVGFAYSDYPQRVFKIDFAKDILNKLEELKQQDGKANEC